MWENKEEANEYHKLCETANSTHPVDTSHILIVLSRDDDRTKSPFGTKVTLDTL